MKDAPLFRLSPTDALSADGSLAQNIPGFAPREAQQEMAEKVTRILKSGGTLICEAGTGTGKTFAYLVPALLSGQRVMLSTGTKNLQDQLFHRDLPAVRDALRVSAKLALLKGRANYLCLFRLRQAERQGELFPTAESAAQFEKIRAWSKRTHSGDIGEIENVPENAEVWRKVTSTTDNCLGQECPDFQDCHLVKARRNANKADILVVNHHLFFADMSLRDDGFGELLPGVQAIILDEAHQLAETAAQFFGTNLSSRQFLELAHDSAKAEREEAGDCPQIGEIAERLEQAVIAVRTTLGEEKRRESWRGLENNPGFQAALEKLREQLKTLQKALEALAERGKMLENCHLRSHGIEQALQLISENPPADQVRWFETFGRGFVFNLTPLSIDSYFRSFRETREHAWVFTSATLAVGESFTLFQNQLGLHEAETGRWHSPFDYRHNSLLYVPENLPEPSAMTYTDQVVDAALPVLQASQGRTFMLFTSYRALQIAAERLREADLPYPLLVQGEISRSELLNRFRELGNAILLGTGSFWEGVDVRGEALSCVIIDKLPFASPGDPILEARMNHLRNTGANPFRDYQLPQAVIALKQGAGRLIRDVSDSGLLMLCDPRLVSKFYGRTFLDSLPPAMPKTRYLETVRRFFQVLESRR